MSSLVDTHCHIQSLSQTQRGEDSTRSLWRKAADKGITIESVLDSARAVGVTRMICVGCTVEDSELAVEFVQGKAGLYAAIGIHPHEAQVYIDDAAALDRFAALATHSKVVAVGECGLDYYYNHSPKEAQIAILKVQIELALKHDLPMIFHVREAFDDFWPVFDSYPGIRGVLHSFTDSKANLEAALRRELFLGVNGITTFNKTPALQEVHRAIPAEKLLLETDAPFLTPTPYRGTICEPKHVRSTAEFLANLRGESLRELAQTSTHNALTLFGLE